MIVTHTIPIFHSLPDGIPKKTVGHLLSPTRLYCFDVLSPSPAKTRPGCPSVDFGRSLHNPLLIERSAFIA